MNAGNAGRMKQCAIESDHVGLAFLDVRHQLQGLQVLDVSDPVVPLFAAAPDGPERGQRRADRLTVGADDDESSRRATLAPRAEK